MDHDQLHTLHRQVLRKPQLEAKLRELESQKQEFTRKIIPLRDAYEKEQADVQKLAGGSLTNYFYQVIGKLDEKLDKERREAYAAKVKLDAAERELSGITGDYDRLSAQLREINLNLPLYRQAISEKQVFLKESGTDTAEKIEKLESRLAKKQEQLEEIKEAICAGTGARSTAKKILSELENADGWNTFDILGGGGIITHMAKHSHLDEAQNQVQRLQTELRRFKTELADIDINANLQVSIDGFLRFADYFFDGLFADWAVGDRISQSRDAVSNTLRQIEHMLSRLIDLQNNAQRETERIQANLEDIIIHS